MWTRVKSQKIINTRKAMHTEDIVKIRKWSFLLRLHQDKYFNSIEESMVV